MGSGSAEAPSSSHHDGETTTTAYDRGAKMTKGILNKLFTSCSEDPKGSVHRAWGLTTIFVVVFFVASIFEMVNLQSTGGSKALVVAAVWTGIMHLVLGILGTFVLKRFPTSFAVGFFLGTVVIIANQDLILFGTFHSYGFGTFRTNHIFANLMLAIFTVLAFFALILFHFKQHIVVAAVDAKGIGRSSGRGASDNKSTASSEVDYQRYDEQ